MTSEVPATGGGRYQKLCSDRSATGIDASEAGAVRQGRGYPVLQRSICRIPKIPFSISKSLSCREDANYYLFRKQVKMSQAEFARAYGISKRALQEWEQGGRQPDSAARAYLTVIAKEPAVVRRALASE